MQNITIEERVALLEIQVTDLEQNVSDLDQDVNFLFDEQVIQDERLFSLETETEGIEEEVEGLFLWNFSFTQYPLGNCYCNNFNFEIVSLALFQFHYRTTEYDR